MLFTVVTIWNQPACLSTVGGIKKMFRYTMEYCSFIKKNEILSFKTKWTELKDSMFNEIYQTQKNKYHMFSVICENLKKKSICCTIIITSSREWWEGMETKGSWIMGTKAEFNRKNIF